MARTDERVNPLTNEHCDCLIAAEQEATRLLDLIQRCESCGLQYGPQRDEIETLRSIARRLRAEFFPHRG